MGAFGINQGSIARRLFVQILLLSLMTTVIISALQLHFRYQDKLWGIEEEIQRIEVSRLNSMSAHLWLMDEMLLRTELEGIMNLPNIQFVEVCGNEGQRIALGAPGMANRIEREYPLVFTHRGIETGIGKFRIQASLDRIWTELLEEAAVLSLGEAGKIFLIAFLVFILFQITVGRHLQSLARQARNLDFGQPYSPFNIDRPSRAGEPSDELEYLVSALNGLYANLKGTIGNLRQTNEKLDQEIGERKRVEEALLASLAEKESLLKEVHHRVKNNLQVISSLLNLQSRKVQNPEVHHFLRDTQNRVRSMAQLHETLYLSGKFAKVSFPQYVKRICAHLVRSYASEAERIRLRHDIADVFLDLDQAIPAGLIVSELVTNAFKHAFTSLPGGEILVALQAEGEHHLVLSVSDNGIGLAAEINPQSADTLGLLLVRNLSRQIDGRMSVISEQGTVFEIVFPAKSTRENI